MAVTKDDLDSAVDGSIFSPPQHHRHLQGTQYGGYHSYIKVNGEWFDLYDTYFDGDQHDAERGVYAMSSYSLSSAFGIHWELHRGVTLYDTIIEYTGG